MISHKKLIAFFVLGLIGLGGWYFYQIADGSNKISLKDRVKTTDDVVRLTIPVPGQVVHSPLILEGFARGTWFFEGSFPIKIIDDNGIVLGTHYAEAQSNWMTEDFVPFKATLTFDASFTMNGTLILEKDNPSGLPANDDERRIPIAFGVLKPAERHVKLFYYNSTNDSDSTGNIVCTRKGLDPVDRNIPISVTPIQDTIQLLLKGELTAAEIAKGISTQYPLKGFELKSASLDSGVLTLTFADPEGTTGGGSCRVGILWMQIEETAKQFAEVTSVRFLPEELFQP